MSRSSASPALALRPSAVGRAVAAGLRRIGWLFTALRHRSEVRQLAELDERALKDIGLSRSEVDGALAVPFYVNPSTVLVRCVERRVQPQPDLRVVAVRPVVRSVKLRAA